MTEQSPSLMTFYKGWGGYNRMLRGVIAPLTREQLDLPASANHWTIGMLAQHLIANRVWWFQVWMGEGSPELAPIAHWDPADPSEVPPLDAPALVAGLDATWVLVTDALKSWTATDLPQPFAPPSAMSAEERASTPNFSREWIIWHVFEHEIHHGGEMSLALGTYGLPGIYAGV